MIPYFGAHTVQLGPITIQVWGLLIALCYALGTFIAYKRAQKKGLDPEKVLSIATWMFFGAMIGARLFHVFVYEPSYYLVHPWEALDPRLPGYSVTGGLLGAICVFAFMVRKQALDWVAYADTFAWGLPWGCGVGRIGCFLIHDHPGTLSNSFLAVRYPDGQGRHDLGLYLSLFGFALGILFLILNRKTRPAGFWVALFFLAEGFSRVWLDVYRVVDTRYFGWTPAQWLGLVFMLISGTWLYKMHTVPAKKRLHV